MADTIDDLHRRMADAAAALDFEEARRLRDAINLLRGGADPDAVEKADTDGIERQRPGAMGLGSNRQQVVPPEGWIRPARPDPLTTGKGRRHR